MRTVIWKPVFLTHPEDVTVEEGSTATFECAATGSPRPEIIWLKDNSALLNPHLIQNESTSDLVLRSVTKKQHSGTYHCRATNLAGTTPSEAGKLTVTSKVAEITASTFPSEFEILLDVDLKMNSFPKSECGGGGGGGGGDI